MLERFAVAVVLFPIALVGQSPYPLSDQAVVTWAKSVEIGTQDGRWLCYGISPDHTQVFFVDPASVKFDKKFNAWTCWCRQIDANKSLEWKSRYPSNTGLDQIVDPSHGRLPSERLELMPQ